MAIASSLLRLGTAPYSYGRTRRRCFLIVVRKYARGKGHTPHTGRLLRHFFFPFFLSIGHILLQDQVKGAAAVFFMISRGPCSMRCTSGEQCWYMIFQTSDGKLPSIVVLLFFLTSEGLRYLGGCRGDKLVRCWWPYTLVTVTYVRFIHSSSRELVLYASHSCALITSGSGGVYTLLFGPKPVLANSRPRIHTVL